MLAGLLDKKNIKLKYKINIKTEDSDDVLIILKKHCGAPLDSGLNISKKKSKDFSTNLKIIVKKKNLRLLVLN